jgi:2-methylisocitrate lyase-like PEP mutase family enzyme
MSAANKSAQILKSLHQRSNNPLILTNVYDILSARSVAKLSVSEALATASYAVAEAAGIADNDLTLKDNLSAVKGIAAVAKEFGKPLTVDFQDGYGSELEDGIKSLIEFGVTGINLEDYDRVTEKLYDIGTAASRIRRVLDMAREHNVPDFVVNARCDVLVQGGELEEVLERGKKYLEAGATTVFIWGGPRGVSKIEVEQLVKAFGGRLNVMLKLSDDGLAIEQLAQMGVARISIGPTLQFIAMKALQDEAKRLLTRL